MSAGTPHLDLDGLADLLAGGGTEDELTHIGTCVACAGALDELDRASRSVQAVLGALPVPAVPADLAARLDAALSAAQADWPCATEQDGRTTARQRTGGPTTDRNGQDDEDRDATRGTPRRAGAAGAVVRIGRRRSRKSSPRLLAAAAAVVAVGLATLTGIALYGDGDVSTTSGASTPALGRADSATSSSSGTDYRDDPAALRAALTALLLRGVPAEQLLVPEGAPAPVPLPARSSTGPGPAPGTAPETAAGSASGDALARLRDPAELAGCLSAIRAGPSGADPLALDYATFKGRPALVVVLPSAVAGAVDLVAVGPGCRAGDAQVLLSTVVATTG